jgi:hypothetical protein
MTDLTRQEREVMLAVLRRHTDVNAIALVVGGLSGVQAQVILERLEKLGLVYCEHGKSWLPRKNKAWYTVLLEG